MDELIIAKEGNPESYYLSTLEYGVEYEKDIIKAIEYALVRIKEDRYGVIVLFGFPIFEKKLNYVETLINQIKEVEPEIQIEHYATFGEELTLDNSKSYIHEDVSCIAYYANNHKDTYLGEDNQSVIMLLQKYHNYNYNTEQATPEILRALFMIYGEMLPLYYKGNFRDFISTNEAFVKHYKEDKESYIEQKLKQVFKYTLEDGCELNVVYAERFTNELAHDILNQSENDKCIVLIGKHTAYSDMYSVRTRNVNAGELAKEIGDGGGKENVGNFFLDTPYKGMLQSLVQYLNNNLN